VFSVFAKGGAFFLSDYDPATLYSEAHKRLGELREEWDRLERPLLTNGSMGQLVEHPLVKMIREHEVLASKLGELANRRHRGPAPSAMPGVGTPLSRLRVARQSDVA
jgi:hypothetical protein